MTPPGSDEVVAFVEPAEEMLGLALLVMTLSAWVYAVQPLAACRQDRHARG